MTIRKSIEDFGEEFLCQLCDESFFRMDEEQAKCPKCSTTDNQWLLPLSLQEDDYEQSGAKGATQHVGAS